MKHMTNQQKMAQTSNINPTFRLAHALPIANTRTFIRLTFVPEFLPDLWIIGGELRTKGQQLLQFRCEFRCVPSFQSISIQPDIAVNLAPRHRNIRL